MTEDIDHQEYSYAKHFNLNYDKPRYRITIVPQVLFWEITYVWVLKHWGKDKVKAPIDGGYQHKFQDYGDLLYYRYPNDKSVHNVKKWKLKGEDLIAIILLNNEFGLNGGTSPNG